MSPRSAQSTQHERNYARGLAAREWAVLLKKQPTVIGWREWVGLPDLAVSGVKAKVDTGARTSSLHAHGVTEFERDGVAWVRFTVMPKQRSRAESVVAEAPLLEYRSVRSSSGVSDRRPVVRTRVQIGDALVPIELTLARRDQMGFRMLLGREALRKRYVVDPGRSFVAGNKPAEATKSANAGAEPKRKKSSTSNPSEDALSSGS